MDDKERRTISFQLSPEEAENLDAEVHREGISRSDYLRKKVFSPANPPANPDIEKLLRHLIYIGSRIHISLYALHETAGTLFTAALEEVYEHAMNESLKYMVGLDDRITKTQAQIAAQANSAAPAGNGTAATANGEQVRRCSDPVHARLFGEDQCFICHVPIEARH